MIYAHEAGCMTFLALAQRAAIGRQDGRSLGVCWRKQGTQSLIRCLEHCIDYVSGRHELYYMSYGSRIDPEAAGQGSAPGRFAKPRRLEYTPRPFYR
jgi:hypothetical protein